MSQSRQPMPGELLTSLRRRYIRHNSSLETKNRHVKINTRMLDQISDETTHRLRAVCTLVACIMRTACSSLARNIQLIEPLMDHGHPKWTRYTMLRQGATSDLLAGTNTHPTRPVSRLHRSHHPSGPQDTCFRFRKWH